MRTLKSSLETDNGFRSPLAFEMTADDKTSSIDDQDIKPIIDDIGIYFHFDEVFQDPESYLQQTFSPELFGLTDQILVYDAMFREWESGDKNISDDQEIIQDPDSLSFGRNFAPDRFGTMDKDRMDHVEGTEISMESKPEDQVLIQPWSKMMIQEDDEQPSPLLKCSLCGATFLKIQSLHLHIAGWHKTLSLKSSRELKYKHEKIESLESFFESEKSMESQAASLSWTADPNLLEFLGSLGLRRKSDDDYQIIQFIN